MPDVRDKRIDLILQQLDALPTLPAVALRVLEVTGSGSSSSADEVVKLVASDPSLTTRILQLVHRADMGVRGEITSIDRAVKLLGFDAVRSAVLAISVFQTFQHGNPKQPGTFSRDAFWMHCVGVGCCCELLAAQMSGDFKADPGEAFICGLLHDMGKIALDAMLPKSFSRVVEAAELLRGNISDLESQIIGLDHMVVGKRLGEKWRLPASIRDSAWLHGQLPEALPATVLQPALVNLVTLADAIVREQHVGYSGNFSASVPREPLLAALGLTAANVESMTTRLIAAIESRAKALGLGQASSNELYHQALSQANRELGKVSDQLASRNRKLAVRAKFFEALSAFQAELRPDAPPQTVLEAIGQTATSTLDVTSAAIFSLAPGADHAEAVLVDHAGQVFESTIVQRAATELNRVRPSLNPPAEINAEIKGDVPHLFPPIVRKAGDGPVLPVGPELEWFLSAVSPRLAMQNRYWICLEADGQCIGGVVWGANVGESQRLSTQLNELTALGAGWALALRTAQIRDEARALSEQLAEANRRLQSAHGEILRKKTLVTVGEMAAGAAHEMNNPLAVISGRSQLLASQLSDPKHKAMAHLVYEQSHRLSEIITELMDFAKPVPPAVMKTDLAELIERSLHEAKAGVDRADTLCGVEVTFSDVPDVTVDPKQVGAALTEIIANAMQAVLEPALPQPQQRGPSSGKAKGRVEIHGAYDPHSNRVVLSVTDNGSGMEEETLRRAFDPFFSARPAGRRRGMGLAKALRWIESSGGSIRLESHLGQGTRALVLLPAAVNESTAKSVQGNVSVAARKHA